MKIFTIGYGNTWPDDLVTLLKSYKIRDIFDVRRKESKSWCGQYHQGHHISRLFQDAGICYFACDYLGNTFDSPADYQTWLGTEAGHKCVLRLAWVLHGTDKIFNKSKTMANLVPCLLCAEKKPEKCHRKLVAEAVRDVLQTDFNQSWEIVHL